MDLIKVAICGDSNPPEYRNTRQIRKTSGSNAFSFRHRYPAISDNMSLAQIIPSRETVITLIDEIKTNTEFRVCEQMLSGSFLYQYGDYMDLHTNLDNQGVRVYATYSDTGDSCFLYINKDGNLVEDLDFKGWTIRAFKINRRKPFVHGVKSNCNRVSIGFNTGIIHA